MYNYSDFDTAFIRNRVSQFRDQVQRRLTGALSEDEFKPLRLMNGLYLQLHAYMLRVAIPYGSLNSTMLRQLAMIAERWDRGYGHFTTRQNIQFNWPQLGDVPDILDALADVDMHAIQTSGNTIRNVTSDHFAAAARDEIADPRPIAELIRQWSSDHPEFQFLPRKFKIAITGSPNDRAVTKAHDIGIRMVRNTSGESTDDIGFEIIVGGGLGRSPFVGQVIRDFLPQSDLLPYLESILRVYNLYGRRDNKYKARIKILLHEQGLESIRAQVESEFKIQKSQFTAPSDDWISQIHDSFSTPNFVSLDTCPYTQAMSDDSEFRTFATNNIVPHKRDDYAIVTLSLKPIGGIPGDATADQMRLVADLAERYAHDEIRVSHEQNLILPHVPKAHLPSLFNELRGSGLDTPNIGLLSDIIACPGMDYCSLATARSIPIAQDISTHFHELGLEHEIGELKIKISGCINACGHHHVGHIGILGLERSGVENYQITLGGDGRETMTMGERAGRGFSAEELLPALERLLRTYLDLRLSSEETFLECYRRLGISPFKSALYPDDDKQAA